MLEEFLEHEKRYGLYWYANHIQHKINIYGVSYSVTLVERWREKFATDSTIRRFCTQLLDLMY